MQPPDKRMRPTSKASEAQVTGAANLKSTRTILQAADIRAHYAAADVMLQCAWLRANAEHTLELDPSRFLMCAMYDFADLLEVAHRLRWFE